MKLAIILVTVLELVIASSSALAETDKPRSAGDPIFLNYEGIAGDVNGDGCTGIQLDSFQWGATNTPTTGASGGGGGAGKVAIHDIPITKHTDSASPNFFKALVTGNHGSAKIDFCRKAGGDKQQPYLEFTMGNTLISSYSMSSGGDRPTESISINFTKITMQFFEQGPNGTPIATSFTFDLSPNTPPS